MDGYSEISIQNSKMRMKEFLSPKEAAEYLSVHIRTIYRLAKAGEIPGFKMGGSWRFKKDILDNYFTSRRYGLQPPGKD